jgi:nitroreductase
MKNFLEIAHSRHSIRNYKKDPISPEIIERCLEAAQIAPSACNAQPWHFVVVNDPKLKNSVADATSDKILPLNHFTKQAPVHIIIVKEKANISSQFGSVVKNKQYSLIDIGIAAEHICLQAASEGLGTCILGWFNEKRIKTLLDIPSTKRIPLIVVMGYPEKTKEKRRARKKISEIVSYNSYGK